jgi:hypothetical protein
MKFCDLFIFVWISCSSVCVHFIVPKEYVRREIAYVFIALIVRFPLNFVFNTASTLLNNFFFYVSFMYLCSIPRVCCISRYLYDSFSSIGSMAPPCLSSKPTVSLTPAVIVCVLHLSVSNYICISVENCSVISNNCFSCCIDAYSLISSTYKRCVILYVVCLFCLMLCPYPVLFRTEDNGFNARQNQSGLKRVPLIYALFNTDWLCNDVTDIYTEMKRCFPLFHNMG